MEVGIETSTEARREIEMEVDMGLGSSMGSAELGRIESREGAGVVAGVDKFEVVGGKTGLGKTNVESVVGVIGVWESIIGVATKGKGSM